LCNYLVIAISYHSSKGYKMLIKKLSIILSVNFLSLCVDSAYSQTKFNGYDNNFVIFKASQHPNSNAPDALKDISFNIKDMYVSEGQDPYNHVMAGMDFKAEQSVSSTTKATMNFILGRHNTTDTAKFFKNKLPNEYSYTNSNPHELNFAMYGSLLFKFNGKDYKFDHFMLAQGHTAFNNPWKIGGVNCDSSDKKDSSVTCAGTTDNGQIVNLTFKINGTNNIEISFPDSTACFYNSTSKLLATDWRTIYNNDSLMLTTTTEIPAFSSACIEVDQKATVEIHLREPNNDTILLDQNKSNTVSDIRPFGKINDLYLQTGNWTNSLTLYDDVDDLPVQLNNWMGKLDETTSLNNIVMPGSHDAGMSELHNCGVSPEALTKTQSLNISGQLNAGSRYFDIRPGVHGNAKTGTLVTYHGTDVGCNGQTIEGVLDNAISFLEKNPSEMVVLNVSHTRDDKTPKKLIELLKEKKYSDYLYKDDENEFNLLTKKISAYRGKILVVFETFKAADIRKEKLCYDQYIEPSNGFFSDIDFIVYDQYTRTNDYHVMQHDQLKKLSAEGALGQENKLFLLSWTLTPNGPLGNVNALTNTAHGHLPYLLTQKIGHQEIAKGHVPNIVYLDFINPLITSPIIALNASVLAT
ncbi:hypothetical protein OAO18_07985, partial [Francisellaceae bacterium]|nr:hypothetical protein [Francisellaceae bacterium]